MSVEIRTVYEVCPNWGDSMVIDQTDWSVTHSRACGCSNVTFLAGRFPGITNLCEEHKLSHHERPLHLSGRSYFIGTNGELLRNSFIAKGGERLGSYCAGTFGYTDDHICSRGEVVKKLRNGSEFALAEWSVVPWIQ